MNTATAPSAFKKKFAFIHNLIWTAAVLIFMGAAFEHAPPELWYGLKTAMLLTPEPDAAERTFVSILAFCIYSCVYVLIGAPALAWVFYVLRRYFVSMLITWRTALNFVGLFILFGLPFH